MSKCAKFFMGEAVVLTLQFGRVENGRAAPGAVSTDRL